MKELDNHMKVQHPNIVRLVGYCNDISYEHFKQLDSSSAVFLKRIYKVLCFEYMQGGSLQNHLSENSLGDDWRTHYKIIKETCEGLHYLHNGWTHPILHLDLKPGNILLDNCKKPKIADFGLSRIYNASNSHIKTESSVPGTWKYMAPELKCEKVISEKADIYSLGVTIIDVIRGSDGPELYHEDLESTTFVENVRTYWGQRDGAAHLDQVEECTKIAICCVHHQRGNRPTIKEIVAKLNATESQGIHALTTSSSSGNFSAIPIPDKLFGASLGRGPPDVVIVYAFDCTNSKTAAWYTVDHGVFCLVQNKLTHFSNSSLGYIYVKLTDNKYTAAMKLVDRSETKATGYAGFNENTITCSENMASGLVEAHNMIDRCGQHNGIILFFSDGLIHKGDFFEGTRNFVSKVPVHTFTLAKNEYNHVLQSIAKNSLGGKFHTTPVPERPSLSAPFSKILDNLLLGGTLKDDESPPSSISGKGLDVVIVYAFDCTNSKTSAWYTVDHGVFCLVQEKLTHFVDSCLGYIYVKLTNNEYTSDMKLVDWKETKATGYKEFEEHTITCTKNMASGLVVAHKMIANRGRHNGVILFFSDGLIHKGDFFDGTANFVSEVPVHTFTLAGDAYNPVLHSIASNSHGGKFHTTPVPERPSLSASFSKLLDSLLGCTPKDEGVPPSSVSGKGALDVVIIYAFDRTSSMAPTPNKVALDVFWLVQEKLTHFLNSCLGYIYVKFIDNEYTSGMKLVDSRENVSTGYTKVDEHTITCTKNMASGLVEAHKMINYRGHHNGIILFFSDGWINKGDFFDGTDNFASNRVPVHTFTLDGDAYNDGLQAIASNSPGGMFNPLKVPEKPHFSVPFSKLLDGILDGTKKK